MSWGSQRLVGTLVRAALGLAVAGTAACANERLVQGECKPLNAGEVCTWARMSGNTLLAFGATIPMRAVESAPAEEPMVWPPKAAVTIAMPAVVDSAAGFSNMNVFWEPHGHPPAPYLVPHFDFHFNNISAADVAAIDCADTTKPSTLPAAYELPDIAIPQVGMLVGLCVPAMGMHALPGAELHSTVPFQKTMIVGYYHQQPVFLEPMITRATLMERRTFSLDVPRVAGEPARVRLPAAFQAQYDSTTQAYRFEFSMPAKTS
jgi:hypothetical protein